MSFNVERQVPGRGHHVPSGRGYPGVGPRQAPGSDRRANIVYERTRPGYHRFSTEPSIRSVHVIHTRAGRAGIIVGIAMAIFGACILPVDPVAWLLIGGLGVIITAAGASAYRAGRH